MEVLSDLLRIIEKQQAGCRLPSARRGLLRKLIARRSMSVIQK